MTMTKELNDLSAVFLPAIEKEMRSVLGADEPNSASADPFYGMIHYHMGWADDQLRPVTIKSGKQIRPLLVLLACSAAGGDWRQALPAAAAVEIIHNFSLVHDDIEDDSSTRRGRPTLWKLWGQPLAINAGDAMFAMAHLALSRLIDRGVPATVTVQALRRFDEMCVDLTRGQFNDMSFERRDGVSSENVTVDEYLAMIGGKTAALLALCAELGALVAEVDEGRVAHFAEFGRTLGLAFQIQDDILGIWGDESMTGKSAATDLSTRKKTLPVLYGLAAEDGALRALYAGGGDDAEFIRHAIELLDEAGARKYAVNEATRYTDGALSSLAAAQPGGEAAAALYQLTDFLLRRDS